MEVLRGGAPVAAGGPTQRAVLAMLALQLRQPVSVDELVTGIWGESDEPLGGGHSIQIHVSRIRALLKGSSARLTTVSGGYRLEREGVTVDLDTFEQLFGEGRKQLASGEPQAAVTSLSEALALWRGPTLMDLRDFPFAAHLASRHDERRADAAEERIAARLALGETDALLSELEALIAEHPYRERLHRQLMTALYRAGRQAAALDAYQTARTRLAIDLGIEPGPELERLHQQILRHDDVLEHATTPTTTSPTHSRSRAIDLPIANLSPLVGREQDVDEIVNLLAAHRQVTLTGPGGVGKTRLALAVSANFESEEGTVFVDLAPLVNADHVFSTIAAAAGSSIATPDELLAELAEVELLLILDNLEHLPSIEAVVAQVLAACPQIRVLATSRRPLHMPDEHEYQLRPLELPSTAANSLEELRETSAGRLFLDRAQSTAANLGAADAPAVAQLCKRLDGLPLALELAAARLRSLTPAAILRHLEQGQSVLARSTHADGDRHSALNATVAWSVDLLREQDHIGFLRLAVFQGSFDLEAAAPVLAAGESLSALDLIERLLEASLLVRAEAVGDEPRYRMLQTIRDYARALSGDDTGKNRDAHLAHLASVARRAREGLEGPEQLDWLHRLDADRADIRSALRWSVESEAVDVGLGLLVSLHRYWDARSLRQEAIDWLVILLALPPGELQTRARALNVLGAQLVERGESRAARDNLEEALAICRKFGDHDGVARALNNLAIVARLEGDYPAAEGLLTESIELSQAQNDRWGAAASLANLGIFRLEAGATRDAGHLFEQAVNEFEELGDVVSVAMARTYLGWVALTQGDSASAADELAAARTAAEDSQTPASISGLLMLEAAIALRRGDLDAADASAARSLDSEFEMTPYEVPDVIELFADAAVVSGRRRTAARLWGAADCELANRGWNHAGFMRVWREDYQRMAIDELGDIEFQQALDSGRSLSWQAVITAARGGLAALDGPNSESA